jgi:hypothetical protein
MRLSYAHLVVLDGLFGEPERAGLLEHLTMPGWDHTQVPRLHRCSSHLQTTIVLFPPPVLAR